MYRDNHRTPAQYENRPDVSRVLNSGLTKCVMLFGIIGV